MTYEQLGRWLYYYYCVGADKTPADLNHPSLTYDGRTSVMGLTEEDIKSLGMGIMAFDLDQRGLYTPTIGIKFYTGEPYTNSQQKLNWWVQTYLSLGDQNKVREAIRYVKLEQEVINL